MPHVEDNRAATSIQLDWLLTRSASLIGVVAGLSFAISVAQMVGLVFGLHRRGVGDLLTFSDYANKAPLTAGVMSILLLASAPLIFLIGPVRPWRPVPVERRDIWRSLAVAVVLVAIVVTILIVWPIPLRTFRILFAVSCVGTAVIMVALFAGRNSGTLIALALAVPVVLVLFSGEEGYLYGLDADLCSVQIETHDGKIIKADGAIILDRGIALLYSKTKSLSFRSWPDVLEIRTDAQCK